MEQNISDEEKRKEFERRRITLSVRFNGAQWSALNKIFWGNQEPHSSFSSIIRTATMEHLKNRYGISIEPHLDFINE